MAKTYAKPPLKVIVGAQKLLADIIEAFKGADKLHRYTIAKEMREDAKELLHMIRRANRLTAGTEDRIELEEDAIELLERIRDKLPVYCRACMTGVKREAQITLSIDNLAGLLKNWHRFDVRTQNTGLEKRYRQAASEYGNAYRTTQKVKQWYLMNKTEKNAIALDMAMSRERVAKGRYLKTKQAFDASSEKVMENDRLHMNNRDILNEVLKDIEAYENTKE